MMYDESTISIALSIMIFVLGCLFSLLFVKYFNTSPARVFLLYIWHSLFCIIYYYYSMNNVADSFFYFEESFSGDIGFQLGTGFVIFLTSLFSANLGFTYLNSFLVYNIIGALGLVAFDSSIKSVFAKKKSNMIFFVSNIAFLPSVSFWSSALGKDAISFLAISLALWASLSLGKRWLLMLISILLMLSVRPHISGLLIVSLAIVVFYRHSAISAFKKISLAIALFAGSVLAVPFALEYSGLGSDISIQTVNDYFDTRQGYNQEGGGGIDISQISLPAQLFTYIFRPLPFEAQGIAALAASFENILLLMLFIYAFFCLFSRAKNSKLDLSGKSFMIVYAAVTWLILAMTTANLGISLRQKWMFLPMLLYVAVSVIAAANFNRSKK